ISYSKCRRTAKISKEHRRNVGAVRISKGSKVEGPWRILEGRRALSRVPSTFDSFVLLRILRISGLRRLFRRRDAVFHERVPFVAVRALPEELGAAVAALQADVRIEVEDGVASE